MNRTRIRWIILLFLFIATTLLYLDRSALGIMAPFLQDEIGWTEKQYGHINSAFMIGYALCFLIMGVIVDKIGTKAGYSVSLGLWAVAQAATALAGSWIGFALARLGLSVGQSGNFPVANKVLAEWFPKKERAFAVGLFNGGANAGTLLSPLLIPVIVAAFGNDWRAAFLWTFPVSMIWIICWLLFYRKPEKHWLVSKQELDYINSDLTAESPEKIKWTTLLKTREMWGICVGKFMADPIWWFYLFWGAKFLNGKYGLNLKEIGIPFFTIYLISWGGGIFLGWLTSGFLKKGWTLNKGRKTGFLICALFALPVMLVPHVNNMWLAIGLIALAAGGHCGWSANIFSLMSDIFPRKATASVTGIGGFAGAVGGALIAQLVGGLLQNMGMEGYTVPFLIASLGYFFALGIMHLLIPKIKPLNL
ncbi:MAG TPA: MFS transporter [Bacteroidales bacterium]|jgi:ACS family hexuronate transporter-like MFS transporter|nr:MFS transporter [Bacteroidales bacterium]HOX73291.1 MFS transporter [Bacteroidales bacterium]HPM88015.1 MFS transporter [Bacteroidales bacterium]HQM69619.1 MFS transporter [Bacteroidales bacterium]